MDVFIVEPNTNEYFTELMNRQKDILMDAVAAAIIHTKASLSINVIKITYWREEAICSRLSKEKIKTFVCERERERERDIYI